MSDETPPHPTLYDVAIHGERQATQDDVDRLMRLGAEWVKCRDALRKALDDMQAAIIAPLAPHYDDQYARASAKIAAQPLPD